MKHKTEIFGALIGAILGPAWPILIPFVYVIYLVKDGDWGAAILMSVAIILAIIFFIYYTTSKQARISEEQNAKTFGFRKPPVKGRYPQYTVPFIYSTPDEGEVSKGDLPLGASLERCKIFLKPETIETRTFEFADQEHKNLCDLLHLPHDGKFKMLIGENNLLYGICYSLSVFDMLDRLDEIKTALKRAKTVMQGFTVGQPKTEYKTKETSYTWTGDVTASDGNPVFMYVSLSMMLDFESKHASLRLYISTDYHNLNPEWVKDWR